MKKVDCLRVNRATIRPSTTKGMKMNYEEISSRIKSGEQTPEMVSDAFAIGEKAMAYQIATGTSWRNPTGIKMPTTEIEVVGGEYFEVGYLCGERRKGDFLVDLINGTDLCVVKNAPDGYRIQDMVFKAGHFF